MRKSGAWYTYEGDQLGQGKENARAFLRDNPDLAEEIELKIKQTLGILPAADTADDEIVLDRDLTVDELLPPTPIDL